MRAREREDAPQRDARDGDALSNNDPPLRPAGEGSRAGGGVREGRVDRSNLRAAPFALILTLALGLHAALYHPHQLAYYNPLVGGGPAAERLILVGWGEGLELAGDYISAQPDGCDRPVAAWASFLLEPFVCSDVVGPQYADDPARAGYTVFYVSQLQRGYDRAAFERLMARGKPAHIVYLNGVAYAYVFRV